MVSNSNKYTKTSKGLYLMYDDYKRFWKCNVKLCDCLDYYMFLRNYVCIQLYDKHFIMAIMCESI